MAQHSVAHISENATQSSQRLVQNVALVVRGKEEVIKLAVVSLLALAGVLRYFLRSAEDAALRVVNPVQVTSAIGVENYATWSSDGGRLAYESNQSGNWDIWVAQRGGEAVNLTGDHAGDDRFPSWSPNGREIAFLSQRDGAWGLYSMSALGGSPREVMSISIATLYYTGAPQWSADGTEIAVSVRDSGSNFVEIASLQTLRTRRIPLPIHEGKPCFDLSWSPDEQFFAYVDAIVYTAEVTRIWVVPSAGGKPMPVTDGLTNAWSPTWSVDGRKLFFVSNRGGTMDLWQQQIGDGGEPEGEAVPVTAGLGIRTASFSPDGTLLAYSRGQRVSNVWRIPILRDRLATWVDAEQLTFDNAFIEHPALSPDGEKLALSSDRAGNKDLWLLPSDGGEMRQVTTDPTPDWGPSWSPDGEKLAFYAYRSGSRDIWVMPSRGGPARQLTSHPAADVLPQWSVDGEEIAFVSRRSGNRDIWIVAAEGGEARQVTVDPASDTWPSWSPDGRWLVFHSFREGRGRLWRMPAEGGEPERLSDGPGQLARFSPDGKVLYFTGWEERAGNLWALSLEDGSEYPVTELAGRRGSIMEYNLATDGRYLYFTWSDDLGDIWVMDVVTE